MEIIVFHLFENLTQHCLKMLMDLDWPYPNWGKRVHSRFQIGCCKHHVHFKQVNNDSGIIEITMEITVYHF